MYVMHAISFNMNHKVKQKKIKKFIQIICFLFPVSMAHAIDIHVPQVFLENVSSEVIVSNITSLDSISVTVGNFTDEVLVNDRGIASFQVNVNQSGSHLLILHDGYEELASQQVRVLPSWISIIPPLLAIFIALTLKNVIPALVFGVWFGATALIGFTPLGVLQGLLDSFQIFVVRSLSNEDHSAIILFSMMVGGMVGIITRNGGMQSIVMLLVKRAKTAIGGQISVWLMGLMIFFDDYSNTLVVGNTARPLTDHLKISREKLAYIVDSTAAPVTCLALITTWIGYQVGLIGAALDKIPELNASAYTVFLYSIPYSFYPILAITFVLFVASTGRDIGPMYQAELRARQGQVSPVMKEKLPAIQGDKLEPKSGVPQRALNAFIPLAVLIISLLVGLYVTGKGDSLTDIIGSADAYKSMLWASLLGATSAALISITQKILTTQETVDAWFSGVKAMLFAMIVLVLAWALSSVSEDLHTADYLVSVLANSLSVELVPVVIFILSALTAFTTGTSWGTMGIMMPLVIPLCWAVMQVNAIADPEHMHILYSAIACNLAGAVWGDHCSPISDTTILSSMASGCDHIEHVRTQIPYALLVGIVAIAIGTIPGAYGLPPWLSIISGIIILFIILRVFGKKADQTYS